MGNGCAVPRIVASTAIVTVAAGVSVLQAQDSSRTALRATLTGQVVAETGRPLSAAEVTVDGAWHTRTDIEGRFRLANLHLGSHVMRVRAIGFEPLDLDVRLGKATTSDVVITLKQAPQVLEDVVVTARRRRLEAVGYYLRRDSGKGRFIEGDSLASIHRVNFMRALTGIGGIHANNAAALDPLPRSIACRKGFSLIVNGWAVEDPDGAFYLRTLHPENIDAVEIYEDAGMPAVDRNLSSAVQVRSASGPTPSSSFAAVPAVRISAALVGAATRTLSIDDGTATPTSCVIVVWERP